jgi:hypothetical protein
MARLPIHALTIDQYDGEPEHLECADCGRHDVTGASLA